MTETKRINLLFLGQHAEMGGGECSLLETLKAFDSSRFQYRVILGNDGPLRKRLQEAGIATEIIAIPEYFKAIKRNPQQKIPFFALAKALCVSPLITKRLVALLYKYDIDILVVNSIKSLSFCLPAARKAKVISLLILREMLTKDFYKPMLLMKIKQWGRQLDRVVCVSNAVKASFVQLVGSRHEHKVSIIYNGVDLNIFNPNCTGKRIKQELSLDHGHIITFIGRFEPWKGQKVLIEAASQLLQRRQDIIFLVAGGPLFGMEGYELECRELAKKLKLDGKMHFLGFRDDVADIIAASDIIVHTSVLPEPFGRNIIEAMASAKPVIAANSGGPREIITADSGITIEAGQPQVLAEAIERLLAEPLKRRSLGEQARKRAQTLFDIIKTADQYEKLFMETYDFCKRA